MHLEKLCALIQSASDTNQPLTTKKGPYLVTNQTLPGRGTTARINLVFWFKLVPRVVQKTQPDALPEKTDLETTAREAAQEVLPLLAP